MDLKSYIFSVILASVIAGIILIIVKPKSTCGFLIKLLVGIFIALTVISPWKSFNFSDISTYVDNWNISAANNTQIGKTSYNNALQASIIDRTQSYILEKASSMGAALTVSITVSDDSLPVPVGAVLYGDISPYTKKRLKEILVKDLGIPEDAQEWR